MLIDSNGHLPIDISPPFPDDLHQEQVAAFRQYGKTRGAARVLCDGGCSKVTVCIPWGKQALCFPCWKKRTYPDKKKGRREENL